MTTPAFDQRRIDLDWLRVIAFLLLIVYHIGMFYVPWSWHVKSTHAPVHAVTIPMLLMNSWRLPLLFFVSGVAVRYALDKTAHSPFLRNRLYRLLLPLLFGMWVVCAPQAYLELVAKGEFTGSVLTFYAGYAAVPWASPEGWSIITPTWNHLWYVLYVLVYTVVLALASRVTSRRFESSLDTVIGRALTRPAISIVLGVPALLLLVRFGMSSSYGAQQTLWGDWHNLTASFLIMLLGFVVARQASFWDFLKRHRWLFLMLSALGGLAVVVQAHTGFLNLTSWAVLRILNCWMVLYTLFGFAQVLLNRDGPLLRYLTAAVFPYYVLHQTIIIVVGVWLSSLSVSLPVELTLLTLATVFLCLIIHHFIIRRLGRWGVVFGYVPPKDRG